MRANLATSDGHDVIDDQSTPGVGGVQQQAVQRDTHQINHQSIGHTVSVLLQWRFKASVIYRTNWTFPLNFNSSKQAILRVLLMIDWLSFTSHPTQNKSFRRRSSAPISLLSTEKLNQTQQKQTMLCIRNKIQHKISTKTKAMFGRLLWRAPSKRTGLFWKKLISKKVNE